ncbi:hypothetical protein BHU72_05200 [Desulfuribacillus stibiiarsenatis]|uniref:Glutamate-1-semialdehyde 2,1-aminomutase n=1 Tax=Desulfuribacillus stibiiarsenatis TaxID=1390249 RepID=A0A1E5L5Z1_9FIRM|nr:aminotransferase class III-fold pyridoxal phosphate-dependent enzyme [Desulfuribacillus stibiiarsenatis]OEH85484.1 hypothetical protein BHU72_05200 [Desulfuribacillus stibiiarsenatis]
MTYNNLQKSKELLERARKITPLGSQTYSKSYRYFCEGIAPAYIEKGKGCYVWDIDGNQYIDFIAALGPIIIGYSDERVNEAIIKQLEKGIIFSQPSSICIELAEKITQIIPGAEMVRFLKNGSDATFAAVKLARAYTGKEMVAISGYHGMQDWYIGSTINNRGVPKAVSEISKTFTYNNIESLELLFEQYPDKISAVILEPVQGDGPENQFLEKVKEVTQKNNAILIFDEVKSGFYYALGGASEYFNVTPDLTTLGKAIANGMPLSVVAGRRELLELIETEGVFISTTFGDETLSVAAALATISILEQKETYEKIWGLGESLKTGLLNIIKDKGLEEIVTVKGLAPYCGVDFNGYDNLSYLDIASVFQQRMIKSSILTLGLNHICLAQTEENICKYLNATEDALDDIIQVLNKKSTEGILLGGKINPIFKRN